MWKEISFECTKEYIDIFQNYLQSLGSCSITYQKGRLANDILKEECETIEVWDTVQLTALFTEEYDLNRIREHLIQTFSSIINQVSIKTYDDIDWERECLQDYNPIQISEKLWICPSWIAPPDSDAYNVIMDPGLAFGTGTHETTMMCLKWLNQNISGGENIIDLGCGSGILGITASILGAANVIGIDIDPDSVNTSLYNSDRNNLDSKKISFYLSGKEPSNMKCDILVANILASTHIKLLSYISNKISENGTIVLSGILDSQVTNIINSYSKYFIMEEPIYNNEWVMLTGKRKCIK